MIRELIAQGGLGNQLFIVMQACRLIRGGDKVFINTSDFLLNKRYDRAFLVDSFLPELFSRVEVKKGFFPKLRYFLMRVLKKILSQEVNEKRLPGDSPFSVTLLGCNIQWSYFQHIDDSLMDQKALSDMRNAYAHNLSPSRRSRLAIHIRRGDYLFAEHHIHGLISIEDLIAEARVALTTFTVSNITIFTDSPDLINIEDFLCLGVPVQLDEGGGAIEVMHRLSSFGGIIASNSSFSLWAGLLGDPIYFSIPQWWMPGVSSDRLQLPGIRRYLCTL